MAKFRMTPAYRAALAALSEAGGWVPRHAIPGGYRLLSSPAFTTMERMRSVGLVDSLNDEWRITPAGRAALTEGTKS